MLLLSNKLSNLFKSNKIKSNVSFINDSENKSDVSQDMQQSIMRSHSSDSLKNKVDLADSIVAD